MAQPHTGKNELSKRIAKIRTLGPPTFFMSLSADDINWTDNLKLLNPSMSDEDLQHMSYRDKCKLLKDNPVLSAIHFNNRWEAFLHHYLLIKPYPLDILQITSHELNFRPVVVHISIFYYG